MDHAFFNPVAKPYSSEYNSLNQPLKRKTKITRIFSKKHEGSLLWQPIKTEGKSHKPSYCAREKIFNGWLATSQIEFSGNLVFVPGLNHEWKLDKLK